MGLTSGGLGAKQSPRTRGFSGWGDIELGPSLPTPVSGDSSLRMYVTRHVRKLTATYKPGSAASTASLQLKR